VTASIPLRLTLRHVEPAAVIMDLVGDINGQAEQALTEAFSAATSAPNIRTVVLNFASVAYINSTGIALIIGLLARARRQHCAVLACGLSDHYREIFEITRLSDFIPVHSDEHAALSNTPAAA
jgi:anti-anti-sigma factor